MRNLVNLRTPEEFTRWATGAKPGAVASYFRGWLFRERTLRAVKGRNDPSLADDLRTANKAWDFHELGIVKLYQRRVGDEDYIYMAVKA